MSNNLKEILEYSNRLKVLFAEDNHAVRIQLMKVFENFFSHIDVQIDGQKALEQYKDFKKSTGENYDLVITDLSMPKLDGIEFCKKIKQINEKQLILVISAHTETKKLEKLNEIGIYRFLQKPVDYRVLLNAFTSIVMEIKEQEKSFK